VPARADDQFIPKPSVTQRQPIKVLLRILYCEILEASSYRPGVHHQGSQCLKVIPRSESNNHGWFVMQDVPSDLGRCQ